MTSVRVFIAIAVGMALVLIAWSLSSCEPCAVVLTGHCEERQHDEEKPAIGGTPIEMPPAPYLGRQRG